MITARPDDVRRVVQALAAFHDDDVETFNSTLADLPIERALVAFSTVAESYGEGVATATRRTFGEVQDKLWREMGGGD